MENISKQAAYTIIAYNKGYRVRRDGTVVSHIGNVLKLFVGSNGYRRFSIRADKARVTIYTYHLQAFQKYGKDFCREGMSVRHLNGDSEDDTWDNLALGTHADNMMDIPKDVRLEKAMKAARAKRKLTFEQATTLREEKKLGATHAELMRKYKIGKSTVSQIVNNKIYIRA